MGTCLFLKTSQSFCIRCFLKIQNSDQPGSWRANIWLLGDSFLLYWDGEWRLDTCSICFTKKCVCVYVSVVGQKHYLQKCSLEYRELDFFPLLAVVQKYNGHPRRKSLFPSPINLDKRHFISNFFVNDIGHWVSNFSGHQKLLGTCAWSLDPHPEFPIQ